MIYEITGMTCMKCVARVSEALQPLAEKATVALRPPRVTLENPTASLAEMQVVLEKLGYGIQDVGAEPATRSWWATYRPLLLIVGYILLSSLLVQIGLPSHGGVTLEETMRLFMAGFFLVFSFFKMLDLRAFADAYAGYDLLAARWRAWGYIYPFVELALGIACLAHWNMQWTNGIILVVMGFSALGVIRAVASRKAIRCACLGTVFQLPMSTVTIVEDLGMVLMAGLHLLY